MGHSYHGSDNLAGEKRSGRHGFYRNVIRQGQTIFASLTNPRLQDRAGARTQPKIHVWSCAFIKRNLNFSQTSSLIMEFLYGCDLGVTYQGESRGAFKETS